ncbi:MAG: site-2 protease family protein [Vulcanimicrobiaceae bacterium]
MLIARIFGIPLRVDWSWLLVFALFVSVLAQEGGPLGILSAPARVVAAAATVLVVFACVVLHEAAHAAVARRYGIATSEIVLFAFGGVSHLESTGTTPGQQAKIAAAGPAASIVVAIAIGGLALLVLPSATVPFRILAYVSGINIVLAIFNLIPSYPLDGGRIAHAAAWALTGSRERATQLTAYLSMAAGALIAAAGVLLMSAGFAANGIWLVLLAWFIFRAAGAEWSNETLVATLGRDTCSAFMDAAYESLEPDIACAQALRHMIAARHRVMPVTTEGIFLGLLALSDFAKLEERDPNTIYVSAIMTPAKQLQTVTLATTALDAVKRLSKSGYHQLPVVDEAGRLCGFITRETVLRALNFAEEKRTAVPAKIAQYAEPP